jgi:hypothetical protein
MLEGVGGGGGLWHVLRHLLTTNSVIVVVHDAMTQGVADRAWEDELSELPAGPSNKLQQCAGPPAVLRGLPVKEIVAGV